MSTATAAGLRTRDQRQEIAADVAGAGPVRLSPSRASDYKTCPQLFKFRTIDRLPEPADIYSTKGTLIHAALEQLFMQEPRDRTLEAARAHMLQVWEDLKADEEYAHLQLDADEEAEWLEHGLQLLENYFRVENPAAVQTHEMEWWVEHHTEEVMLRGIIDRVEVSADGDWILSDYKTGRSPSETYALGSFFGLKFYALVCWRRFGKMPKLLRLIHLREPEIITLVPTRQMLEGLEKQLHALAHAIQRAHERDDWRPRVGRLCDWCPHRAICPAFASSEEDPIKARTAAP